MNNTVSIKKNFIYSSVFQVIILLVPLVTTPYISRVLGAENVGKYSYASAMVTYFTYLADFGSSIYGQRKIAYFRDNKEMMSHVFWNTFFFRCIMSMISLALYMIYAVFLEGLNLVNAVIALNIVNVALDISWFYQGIENFKCILIRNLIVRGICLCGIFVFVRTSDDTWKYVLIWMVAQVFGSLSMWQRMPKNVCFVSEIKPFDEFKSIALMFLPSIAVQIYTLLDKSMLNWIAGSNYANGCYDQSEKIARWAMTIVTSIGTVVLPRVANLYQNDNLDEAKMYIYKAFRAVWMLAIPIMFGMIGVSSVFIPLFLGTGYDDSIGLLCIFSVLVLVVSMSYVSGISYLIPTKQQNIYTVSVTVAAVVNFCMNLFLIARFGAFGAAFASVMAETVGTAVQIVYCVVKRQLDAKKIFETSWKYLISGIVMLVFVEALKVKWGSGALALVLLIMVGMASYTGMLFILKDSFFVDNVNKILKRFKLRK